MEKKAMVTILVLVVISLVFLVSAVNVGAQRKKASAQIGNLQADIKSLKDQLRRSSSSQASLEKDLKETSVMLEDLVEENSSLRDTLAQEQLINQNLRSKLEKTKSLLEAPLEE